MANIRDLKKDLNWLTYEVLTDCMIANLLNNDKADEVETIMHKIMDSRTDLISRIGEARKTKDEKEKKQLFKAIEKDMYSSADEAFKGLSEIIK